MKIRGWIIPAVLGAMAGVGGTVLVTEATEARLTGIEQEVLNDIQEHEGLDEWCNAVVPGWGGIEVYVSAEPGDKTEYDLPDGGHVVSTIEVAMDAETADAARTVHEQKC